MLLFLAPVFYPLTAVPPEFRDWLWLNPLTVFIEQTRGLLLGGVIPTAQPLVLVWIFSAVTAWLGFAWFQRTRRGFADVL